VKSGDQSKVPVPSPLSAKATPVGSVPVFKDGMVASGSLAETSKFKFVPSVVLRGPIAARMGAWLPDSFTVIVTTSLSRSDPSEA